MAFDLDTLNSDCVCLTLDRRALAQSLRREVGDDSIATFLERERPTLLADQPLFVAAAMAQSMRETILAIERVVRLPGYQQAILAAAPAIAGIDHGPIGVFMGYDFHLGADGPRLIEINTNAGGALINAFLAEAQRACCDAIERLVPAPDPLAALSARFVASFRQEWQRFAAGRPLRSVAIVDHDPVGQYLYPEFRLFQRMLERAGLVAVVADPAELVFDNGTLSHHGQAIDLVYNRLTDFYLEAPGNAALGTAYLAGAVALTPNPRAHALYADKRNLALLTDPDQLRALGASAADCSRLVAGIARTRLVRAEAEASLWSERSRLFFKPAHGYASKAAYRGDKLTRKVFADILAGSYVAQELVVPSSRAVLVDGVARQMKVDVRNYTYDGEVQLLAARLYEGQTTNFRTRGGGFAPVFTERRDVEAKACACHDAA